MRHRTGFGSAGSFIADGDPLQLADCSRDKSRAADVGRHARPRGVTLRRSSIEYRKRKLAKLLRAPHLGIVLNDHYEGDGEIVFKPAVKLGCQVIVSKRLGSLHRSGHSVYGVKVKNPKAPAVRREAEEDWSNKQWRRARRRACC